MQRDQTKFSILGNPEDIEEKPKFNMGRWDVEEHELFLEGLRIHGKNWDLIETHVKTRDATHCRSHG